MTDRGERCGVRTDRGTPCRMYLPCKYHGRKSAPVDVGDVPDASDFDAVNVWLRGVAMKALAAEIAAGPLNAQTFDYYRRAIQSLNAEWREAHPEPEAQDAVDSMMEMLKQVAAKHQIVVEL